MATEKLVDGNFLGKLLSGSFEVAMGSVEEAVSENAGLFGGEDETQVRVIGTYPDHIVVVNKDGEFYRCEWKIEGDAAVLSGIHQIDVPIVEGEVQRSAIRSRYKEAVSAILECRTEEAEEKLKELLDLVNSGVPMTAESVEKVFVESTSAFSNADWIRSVRENSTKLREWVGSEVRTDYPRVMFESLTSDAVEESVADARRSDVVSAIKNVQSFLADLNVQTAPARMVVESIDGSAENREWVSDLVLFTEGFTEALDDMSSIVEDVIAVAEDGCVKCLARLHDGIATQMDEWSIAAAFTSKMARRFESNEN